MHHLISFGLCAIILPLVAGAASPCVLNPPQSSVSCGQHVRIDQAAAAFYSDGSPQFVTSVAACAELCARRRFDEKLGQTYSFYTTNPIWCKRFSFDPTDGFCQLLGFQLPDDEITPDKKSTTLLYDISCYNCGPACPEPFGKNLFDNSGFEKGLLGPWRSVNGSVVLGKQSGNMFQCSSRKSGISASNSLESICSIDQSFNHCPNDLLSLSFDYKLPINPNVLRRLSVTYGDLNFEYVANMAAGESDASFQSFQGFFPGFSRNLLPNNEAEDFAPLTFTFLENSNESSKNMLYELDNVRIVRVPSTFKKSGTPSIVKNGGFDGKPGKLEPWHIVNPRQTSPAFKIVPQGGLGSRNALKIYQNSNAGFERVPIPLIYQMIQTTPGVQYVLSFDYKTPEPSYYVAFSSATEAGTDPARFTSAKFSPPMQANNTYSASVPFVASDTTTNLSIAISIDEFSEIKIPSILIDDISVKEIAKPVP